MASDHEIIAEFIKLLKQRIDIPVEDLGSPDLNPLNQERPSFDRHLRVGKSDLALEHTSLDPYSGKRQQDQWFVPLASRLEALLSETVLKLDYQLHIIFHQNSKPRRNTLAETAASIRTLIEASLKDLSDKSTVELDCLGLRFSLNRYDNLSKKLLVMRYAPAPNFARDEETARLLKKKKAKLSTAHNNNFKTLLLVEYQSVALDSWYTVAESIQRAMKTLEFPHSIMLFDKSIHGKISSPEDLYLIYIDGQESSDAIMWENAFSNWIS